MVFRIDWLVDDADIVIINKVSQYLDPAIRWLSTWLRLNISHFLKQNPDMSVAAALGHAT